MRSAHTSWLRSPGTFPRAFWAVLACGLLLAGCAAPSAPPVMKATPAHAHLVVINQTDYEWHIAIMRASGESIRDSQLQARASVTVDLAGGDYVIEQTALAGNTSPEMSRKISTTLEAGQTYRWRLVTLLSEREVDADSQPAR